MAKPKIETQESEVDDVKSMTVVVAGGELQTSEEKKEILELNAPELAPIEERLAYLEHLTELADRREQLVSSYTDVCNFYVSPNGNCKITLSDGKNRSFSITNTAVIAEQVEAIKSKLNEEIKKIDGQLYLVF